MQESSRGAGDEALVLSGVTPLETLLARFCPQNENEAADVARIHELVAATEDPWQRSIPLHITASAMIVHPATERVLLRWHRRQRAWLQVGGHGDEGETDPVAVALREGREETGLEDLVPWPDAALVHVVIVPVPATTDDPEHEHADVRFVLATANPDAVRPERPDAPLRWLTLPEAQAVTTEDNVRETLARTEKLFSSR
ncbi:hypothetical protein Atai01_18150 [Amycolatopsis taiwanensis]|uniref:Nudix hydrolase domain-containing protein n=1 Tax=Amycolatopsis taiwanensis TaxID=342230 RepID=A0A9W6VG72_9PSEU|nr:hypothetical protein Atai01_18150 [Amycolatopsis taiwanensis]